MIDVEDIVIDAKSGVSGAGRGPDELHMYCEIADGVHAYRVGRHRLSHEIELGLSSAACKPVEISFTPHMIPMNRGTLVTMYAKVLPGYDEESLRNHLISAYKDEPFIRILPNGVAPGTRMVRGSNYCVINVFAERAHNRVVILAAIDNVVKGAAGQAVQIMNIMFGLHETAGLEQQPIFP
jgi:N-acetyl-gamma-glutamyl-phosphate reductase